ncbi:MAG TPA: DUF4386 domain-containing protein [Bryobacteraceae bacterium]|nr:DUF4386 domain-containing protein [Bryobacteraceae bacterium]
MPNASATARNILAHPVLYRLGGAAETAVLVSDTCVALLFYALFKPVSRSLSLSAAVFRLLLVAVIAVSLVNYFAPLGILGNPHFQNAFRTEQLQALALVSIEAYSTGYDVALVFFGLHCILVGYLIFRSLFLPRILGLIMAAAGVAWLTFLWPPFTAHLYPWVLFPGALGEGLLTLWLLAMGVNPRRWNEQAAQVGYTQC